MTDRCISACIEKERMGLNYEPCLVCISEKLSAAAEFAFAFLDSVEWNDNTSEDNAENAKQMLQDAISYADRRGR